jgi:hypothetical protein
MKVIDALNILKELDTEAEINFCYGDAIAYSINQIYQDGNTVWFDVEEPDET